LVDVRGFDPFGTGFLTIPDNISGPFELEGLRIQFVQINTVMAFVQTFLADKVSYVPQGAVIIKEKTGVNAVGAFHYNGVAPRTGRVFGSDYIIVPLGFPTLGHKGVDDIKGSLMIADAGSPEPFRSFTVFIIQLCGPVDPMADLLPVYQIPAVE